MEEIALGELDLTPANAAMAMAAKIAKMVCGCQNFELVEGDCWKWLVEIFMCIYICRKCGCPSPFKWITFNILNSLYTVIYCAIYTGYCIWYTTVLILWFQQGGVFYVTKQYVWTWILFFKLKTHYLILQYQYQIHLYVLMPCCIILLVSLSS